MIGDSLTTDIRGGVDAGMVTVWVAPPEVKAEIELRPHLRVWSLFDLLERLDEDLP